MNPLSLPNHHAFVGSDKYPPPPPPFHWIHPTPIKSWPHRSTVRACSGARHREAVMALRGCGDALTVLLCDGFDNSEVAYWQSRPGCAGNPLSQVDLSKRNSQESISSIDRDMTTEELNRLNQVTSA